MIAGIAGAFAALVLAAYWLTVGLSLAHLRRGRRGDAAKPITLLRPVCGLDPLDELTLGSSFELSPSPVEVIFCVADASDPVVPLVHRLMAAHPEQPARLLVGEDRISGNPKLNNLEKGWQAAPTDWIAMADSNLLLPKDYLAQLSGAWREDTGLVSSPAVGRDPQGIWARLECAFLNGNQARVQLAADQLGMGFAQGKTLFWHRPLLDAAGGLAALGHDLAEDVASTKVVRAAGKVVHLTPAPFAQPIGQRSLKAVWGRQLRWSQVRYQGFAGLFLLEPLNGPIMPVLALVGTGQTGIAALWLAGWYGAEALLARRAGWPMGPADLLAAAMRDAMLPILWLATFGRKGFEWRGTAMTTPPSAKAG